MTNIVIVFQNADFTEGRGPMLFDGAFSNTEKAKAYVNSKGSGIYGAKPPEGMTLADWCMAKQTRERGDGSTYEIRADGGWGGYDILEVKLDDKGGAS